jgi:hypothetical protein
VRLELSAEFLVDIFVEKIGYLLEELFTGKQTRRPLSS